MSLADYLAKNYLSADASSNDPPKKKRKHKHKPEKATTSTTSGLTIAEDDSQAWKTSTNLNSDGEADDDNPLIYSGSNGGPPSKSSKKSKWLKIGSSAPSNSAQQAADAILAGAVAENQARQGEDDGAPTVVDGAGTIAGGDMEDVTMAEQQRQQQEQEEEQQPDVGLQTAEQVGASLRRKEKEEKRKMIEAGLDATGKAQETIYRDASGRIINVGMKRAELRAKAEEEERKKREELESRKGDVQRREKEERRREIEEVRGQGVARFADDIGLNEELKERERWNDPMANLIAAGKAKGGGGGKKGGKKGSGKTYQGAFEPNRYGIRPGWRWDGVDRGNGFERKWFAARNKARDRQELEYMWQMDE